MNVAAFSARSSTVKEASVKVMISSTTVALFFSFLFFFSFLKVERTWMSARKQRVKKEEKRSNSQHEARAPRVWLSRRGHQR